MNDSAAQKIISGTGFGSLLGSEAPDITRPAPQKWCHSYADTSCTRPSGHLPPCSDGELAWFDVTPELRDALAAEPSGSDWAAVAALVLGSMLADVLAVPAVQ